MNALSVIIPSKTLSNFLACAESVRKHEPRVRIIAVNDGIPTDCIRAAAGGLGAEVVNGVSPFVFARNVNIGIKAAGDDDVVLMNDDAILQTEGGFTKLRLSQFHNSQYGVIAATTNNVGNVNQYPQGVGLRAEPRMVCFVCVYIPRAIINKVGLLDERYIHYGLDDDDYCLQVRNAGFQVGINDDCFVDHKSLRPTYRSDPKSGGNYFPNLEIFKQKWGFDNFGRKA